MACTVTSTYKINANGNRINRINLDWTSDSGGAATGTVSDVCGTLLQVEFIPGTGGTQPTDLYDLTLTDDGGLDVLAGLGANLSNSTKTRKTPGVSLTDGTTTSVVPMVLCESTITLTVSNAGNAKTGTVRLYVA